MDISNLSKLKVAIATESMTSFGGSDRTLFSLLKLFPDAVIYTTIFNKSAYLPFNNEVRTSFLQNFKFLWRHFSFLFPIAFEMFDFKDFDLVISLSSGPAKGIITGVYQKHVGIVFTPPRFLWDRELNARGSIFKSLYRFASIFISHYLRIWDVNAIKRVDYLFSNSKYIQKKIQKVYKLDAKVLYPGIPKEFFETPSKEELAEVKLKYNLPDNFVFTLSRLFDHKRVDWNIKACVQAKTHLCIVGKGPDLGFLKRVANNSPYIHFLGPISDSECRCLYYLSDCFVFSALEDFGYVTLESLAQGRPVIGLNDGGTREIVEDGVHGKLINNYDELVDAISKKVWRRYNSKNCIKRAKLFTEELLLSNFTTYLNQIYEKKN